jgi:ribonuclease P protein component
VPLTFGIERPGFPSEYEGVMAFATVSATLTAPQAAAKKDWRKRIRPHAMLTNEPARFPPTARLLRHADFERVYKEGRRHFSATLTVFYLARPKDEGASVPQKRAGAPALHGLRVGFTVGRALGGAVQRNRMKRRLREAVRLTRPVPGVAADVVINPKKSLLKADFESVLKEVGRAFEVIEQKLQKLQKPEKPPSNLSSNDENCAARIVPESGNKS